MKAWDDLVSTALLGTAKRGLPESTHPALRSLPLADDPAGTLLDQAAVLAAFRRAGAQPRPDVAVGEPAPAETLPRVPNAATRRLAALLDDRVGLLTEWLGLCAEAGARVPEEHLPELLERARVNRALAERLAPVAGERGRWLAAQNPAWQHLLEPEAPVVPDVDVWETGRRAARVDYLTALRSTEPAAARELLASTWSTEDPDDRVEFVLALSDGLSPADEPFLEEALDDRRGQVREVAELLLGRLPESAYSARMRERLLSCVAFDGRFLEVTAPREVGPGMRRDGISAKPRAGSGESTGDLWVRELVTRAPLSAWLELTGLTATEVVTLPVEPYDDAVRSGWWQAAVRQADPEWAAALVDTWQPGDPRQPGELLDVLEPAQRRSITVRMLRDYPAEEAAVVWIAGCPGPWDDNLGRAVLKAIGRLRQSRPYALSGVRAVLADRLPRELVDELQELAEQRADPMTGTLLRVADDIRFRYEMAQELT